MKYKKRVENKQSGFTLIELIVTLAIIVILVAIAVPGFSAWLPKYRLKNAASDLFANIQLARMTAIKTNQNCAINFTTGPDQYTITGVSKTVVLGDYGSEVQFEGPSGETFSAATITFNSRGMSNAGYVYLSNNNNSAYYRVGPLSSGVIKYHKYKGGSWVGKWD